MKLPGFDRTPPCIFVVIKYVVHDLIKIIQNYVSNII